MSQQRQQYIEDTQMFQRIAGTEVSSTDDLGKEFDSWKRDRKERAAMSIRTHRVIQDIARGQS